MIKIGRYRIVHESEIRKFEKLHHIFKTYSDDDLDKIISGKCHIHTNPRDNPVDTFDKSDINSQDRSARLRAAQAQAVKKQKEYAR